MPSVVCNLRHLFVLTLLLWALTLMSGCGSQDPGEELWIIGLDGADWDQLDPMIARGELPNLAKLKSEGASGILLSDTPMISPILWTSISTGKTPDLHGVTWFMTDAPDGSKIPISSEERKVRTFWNIASEAGLSCGITGWWATWPAEPINGYLVSDAVAWHSFGITGRGNPAEGKTWPWDFIHQVNETMPDPATISDDLMTRMVHLPADQLAANTGVSIYDDPISHLRQALATTRGYTDLTLARLATDRPRVMSVYYEGTDAISHLFGKYQGPRLPWISEEDYAAYKDVVDEYWKWQDAVLGEILAQRGPQTTVMIVSDHGFRMGSERRKEDHFHIETADADHQPDGVIIVHGPNVAVGSKIEDADIYDVTPTILYLLDLAVGRDMVGHPLTQMMEPTALSARPVQWVATYETSERARASGTVKDGNSGEDLEKMLRSLGYIAGSESGSPGDDDGYTSEQIVNLATVLMGQGRADEAVEKLQAVLKEHPGNFEIRINLAQALYRNNEKAASKTVYSELLAEFPEKLEIHEDFGRALQLSGEFEEALVVYDQGLSISNEWVAGMAGKARCLERMGRASEGEELLEQAQRIDPRNYLIYWNLGLIQKNQGHWQESANSLTHALELEPSDAQTAIALAEVHLQGRNIEEAEKILRKTMAKGGDKASLLAELGSLQLRAGDQQGALETLAQAHKLDRNNTDVLGNLGMAYAMSGSLPSAIDMFKKLVKVDPGLADAHAQLGAMQAQNGQLNEGIASLRKAVALAPGNPSFHLNLAYGLHQSGDLDGAAEQFRKVIELDPGQAHAHFGLGRLEISRGNTDEGQRLIQKARQLDPSLPAN